MFIVKSGPLGFEVKWQIILCLPGGSVVKNPPTNAGDADLIPGLGRSCGEGNGNPLQYFFLGNPMDRGAWSKKGSDMTYDQTTPTIAYYTGLTKQLIWVFHKMLQENLNELLGQPNI